MSYAKIGNCTGSNCWVFAERRVHLEKSAQNRFTMTIGYSDMIQLVSNRMFDLIYFFLLQPFCSTDRLIIALVNLIITKWTCVRLAKHLSSFIRRITMHIWRDVTEKCSYCLQSECIEKTWILKLVGVRLLDGDINQRAAANRNAGNRRMSVQVQQRSYECHFWIENGERQKS